MTVIVTENHGSLVVSSTFWGSPAEAAGKLWCSVNAGCIRLLMPASARPLIEQCRQSRHVILSRGPWSQEAAAAIMDDPPPIADGDEAVEILLEDETPSPVVLHLTPASFDAMPGEPPAGQEWTLALWTARKGRPHKALERACHWRRVERLPWLEPWEGANDAPSP